MGPGSGFGLGFQPEGIGGEQQDWDDAEIETFNNYYDHRLASVFGDFEHWYWQTDDPSHQLTVGGGFISDRVSSISIEDAGSGYSMPCKVIILGGFPQLTNEGMTIIYHPIQKLSLMEVLLDTIQFQEAEIVVSKIDTNGSILDFTILDPGIGYVPYRNIPKTDPEPFTGHLNWMAYPCGFTG